jgi:hypothetical protein
MRYEVEIEYNDGTGQTNLFTSKKAAIEFGKKQEKKEEVIAVVIYDLVEEELV